MVGDAPGLGGNAVRGGRPTGETGDNVSCDWVPRLGRVAKVGARYFWRSPGVGDRMVTAGAFRPAGEPTMAALAALALPAAAAAVARGTIPAPAPAPTQPVRPAPAFSLWGLKPGG